MRSASGLRRLVRGLKRSRERNATRNPRGNGSFPTFLRFEAERRLLLAQRLAKGSTRKMMIAL